MSPRVSEVCIVSPLTPLQPERKCPIYKVKLIVSVLVAVKSVLCLSFSFSFHFVLLFVVVVVVFSSIVWSFLFCFIFLLQVKYRAEFHKSVLFVRDDFP